LLRALQRRWPLALALGLLLAPAAGAGAWLLLSARYTAFAQLHLAAVPPSIGPKGADTPEGRSEFATFQKTQAARIKSRLVLTPALARDEVKRLDVVRQQADPVAWLEEEIKVEHQDGNEIMTVSLSGSSPSETVTIVDAVVKSYEEQIVNAERDRRNRRVQELDKIYADTDKQLRQDKEELRKLAEKHGTSDREVLAQQQMSLMTDLTEVKKQLSQVRLERMNAERRLQALKVQGKQAQEPAAPSEADLSAALDLDPVAKDHRARISKLKDLIREYDGTPNEQTPTIARRRLGEEEKALQERRDTLKADLAKRSRSKGEGEYEAAVAQVQGDIETLKGQDGVLEKQAEALTEQARQKGTSSTELEMLRAKIEREKHYADTVWDGVERLRVELQSPPRVTLLQEAALQKKDIKRQLLAASGAALCVLSLTALAIAWLEFRTRRIRNSEEVIAGLGIRVLGAVPYLDPQAGTGQREGVLESIDAIRTLLLHDAGAEATRVVMVTSAASGEGKTTLASGLADSLVRAGRRVLLIDCDLRGPAVHQMYELPLQPGFSEVLLGEIDLADAIQQAPVPGLSVITAGQWDREVLRALARDGTGEIFEKLRTEYEFVVIDSHPVLAATDSLLLGQHVDAVLLSVLRDVSRSPHVYSACQRLATLGVRVLGAVVNGATPDDIYAHGIPHKAAAVS
jgi:capsular exopolysaccharide synthesis family protein